MPAPQPFADDLADWRPIAPAARRVWGVVGTVAITVVFLPLAIAAAVFGSGAAAIAVLAAAGVAVGGWWTFTGRRWRAWGYAEREQDLLVRRGVLIRRLTVVPYGRMQFVDVKQGPLARALGVASIQLHTAAAASDAEIPLLDQAEAARLRERLTDLGEARAAGL